MSNSRKRVLASRSLTEEVRVDASSDDSIIRAFHGSSRHFFSPFTCN